MRDVYKRQPQGGIISPLLANIYLHELDKFVMKLKSEFDTPGVGQITPCLLYTSLEALLYFMLNEGNEKIDEEEHNE